MTTTTRGRVAEALAEKRYSYRSEVDLHRALSAALDSEGVEHEREVRVPGGRIDFVVERCGIEVKIKGSTAALDEQMERYGAAEGLDEFLVVTTRPAHRQIAERTTNGKPIAVLVIGTVGL